MPEPLNDMNRNQDTGYFNDSNNFYCSNFDEPLDINLRNLENLSLMDNFGSAHSLSRAENNEAYFQDFEPVINPYIDDLKEGNISRTVRVPSSEHVAEIVGRQGCKIKDLRARTNTYIKTPMRTQSPVFVVTGKEEAVLQVIEEIQNAADHFTHIRASRNHHKSGGGPDSNRPVSREGDVMIQVTVPYRVVGLVVGLKGQTIKAIQQDTDTFIVTPNRDKAPIFEIRGQPENVERARTMILRHIETRTRHCRIQDTPSLQAQWSDELRHNGNDYSYYHNDISPQNDHSSCGTSTHNGFINDNVLSGLSSQVANFNNMLLSTSPTSHINYSWRDYSTGLDQLPAQNGHMASWSSVTSDYTPILCSTPSLSSQCSSLMSSSKSCNSFPCSMSVGSISSSSNSCSSISPPQEFEKNLFSSQQFQNSSSNSCSSISPPHELDKNLFSSQKFTNSSSNSCSSISPPQEFEKSPFSNQQFHNSYRSSISSMSLRDLKDLAEPSTFTRFPLLSTPPVISAKASLVLGNLFQSSRSLAANLGTPTTSTSDNLVHCSSGLLAEKNQELNGFESSLSNSSLGYFPSLIGDISPFASQMNAFSSLESSPAKSSSLSDTSGSQGSPTPRVCKICEEADVVAALVPCGHNLFCMECADVIVNKPLETERKCPVCKDTAADVLRIRA